MNLQHRKREEYLSKDSTDSAKGILSICIFLCHFWGAIASKNMVNTNHFAMQNFGRICTVLGYLSVACFFFFSGYGLMYQYRKKGSRYLEGFLLRRVAPLYLVCIVFILFYWGASVLLGEAVGTTELIRSFLFGGTVIKNGWYLQAILLWYILFFLSYRFAKTDGQRIAFLLLSFVFYIVLCLVMRLSSTWYEGCFCLLLGILWAKEKERIEGLLSKRYPFILLGILLSFAVSFVLGNFSILGRWLQIVFKCFSAANFSVLVVLLLKVLSVRNAVTDFLGRISLEIYVLHGFFLVLFSSRYIMIRNPVLYGLAALGGTVLLATAIHPGVQKLLSAGKIIGKGRL